MKVALPLRHHGRMVRILDVDSEVPLYEQLADRLEQAIRNGDYRVKTKLPSKRELIEKYGVSAATVDEAMKQLKRHGVARGRQGKGVYAIPFDELPPED